MSNNKISAGNALEEGQDRRGWYVGAFIEPEGALQHNADVEIKWGIHPKDEQRSSKACCDPGTVFTITKCQNFSKPGFFFIRLVSGSFDQNIHAKPSRINRRTQFRT